MEGREIVVIDWPGGPSRYLIDLTDTVTAPASELIGALSHLPTFRLEGCTYLKVCFSNELKKFLGEDKGVRVLCPL